MPPCHVLAVSGSLRAGSTNTAVVLTAAALAVDQLSVEVYSAMRDLPHFNPDDDAEPLDPAVHDLRTRLDKADAVLFCTPEYAGALPGSFKNLLDWTVGGGTYAKPAAWINASAGTGAIDAHNSLRRVLERTGTHIVEAACAQIPVSRNDVGSDGLIRSPETRDQIAAVLHALREYVRRAPGQEGITPSQP